MTGHRGLPISIGSTSGSSGSPGILAAPRARGVPLWPCGPDISGACMHRISPSFREDVCHLGGGGPAPLGPSDISSPGNYSTESSGYRYSHPRARVSGYVAAAFVRLGLRRRLVAAYEAPLEFHCRARGPGCWPRDLKAYSVFRCFGLSRDPLDPWRWTRQVSREWGEPGVSERRERETTG
jgi:hypothetical protein